MRILIMSDSHGLVDEIKDITSRHQAEVDYMIHCGDSELSVSEDVISNMYIVRGNCDYDSRLVNEIVTEIDGYRFYITHGHLQNVKHTLLNLTYRALENNAHIVCFGHSHIAGAEIVNNILFINPGSIRMPRMRKEKTYVILEIENSIAKLNFYEVDSGLIEELTTQFKLEI